MKRGVLTTARIVLALCVVPAFLSGCARTPARMLWREGASVNAEAAEAIQALAREEVALHALRAQGTCIVSAPELVGRRKFNVTVLYRAPGDLAVRGFDSTGITGQVLRLVVLDDRLEFEVPEASVELSEMLAQAPPGAIAQELFRPEQWNELSPRKVRVLEKQVGAGFSRLVLLVNKRFGLFRRVVVEGPDWKLLESELLNQSGESLARVEWQEYVEKDGVRVPGRFEASFPQGGLILGFNLAKGKIAINPEVAPGDFLDEE